MNPDDRIGGIVSDGIRAGTFPGAVVLVRKSGEIVYHQAAGHRQLQPEPLPMSRDTLFDLASLTKPLATAPLTLYLLEKANRGIEEPIGSFLDLADSRTRDIQVLQLLTHTGGLAPETMLQRLFPDSRTVDREVAAKTMLEVGPIAPPGREVLYSCTGYLLLGLLIETLAGSRLADVWYNLVGRRVTETTFNPVASAVVSCATTEYCPWRKSWIRGIVHDESSFCRGGDGGNAGLFATAEGVLSLLGLIAKGDLIDARLLTDCQVSIDGARRSAGFMMPGRDFPFGSCFGESSYGHTGFTGTSVVVDPDAQLEIVVLTNRVHLGRERTAEAMRVFRKHIHETIHSCFA